MVLFVSSKLSRYVRNICTLAGVIGCLGWIQCVHPDPLPSELQSERKKLLDGGLVQGSQFNDIDLSSENRASDLSSQIDTKQDTKKEVQHVEYSVKDGGVVRQEQGGADAAPSETQRDIRTLDTTPDSTLDVPESTPEPHTPPCTQKPKTMAMWLAPSLTYEAYPVQALEELRTVLIKNQVNTVYLNVGQISWDGTQTIYDRPSKSIRTHTQYAKRILSILQRKPSPIRVYAWLSGTTDLNRPAYVRLTSSTFRSRLTSLAAAVVQLGFDGVHLNIEPIPDRTYCPSFLSCFLGVNRTFTGFKTLLQQVSARIGRSRLSVTSGTYFNYGGTTLWTQDSYKHIVPHTGQLVVLNYDIGILAPTAQKYQEALTRSARNIVAASGAYSSTVIFGLPDYLVRPNNRHHLPHETFANAHIGLIKARVDSRKLGGFALYTEQDWTNPTGTPLSMQKLRTRTDWTTWHKLLKIHCP